MSPGLIAWRKYFFFTVFRHTEIHQQVWRQQRWAASPTCFKPRVRTPPGSQRRQKIEYLHRYLSSAPAAAILWMLSAWYQAPPGCCWPPKVATSALGNIRRSLEPSCVQHSQHLGQSQHLGNINSSLQSSCMEEQQYRGYFELLPAQDKWGWKWWWNEDLMNNIISLL